MIDLDGLSMRVGLGQFKHITEEQLRFIKQCGVDDFLLNTPRLPGQQHWAYEDLAWLVQQSEEHGLRLMAIENVPSTFYDHIMLGGPDRERQLENMIQTVQNIGRAGIPVLGYHFMPTGVWRTSRTEPARGGAQATGFKLQIAAGATDKRYQSLYSEAVEQREYTVAEMWEHYDWYLERILPICEAANVRLALHPADPPVDFPIGGVPVLFNGFDAFARAMERFDSPMHGLNFCHGCWSEMRGGSGVVDAIRYFGARDKIVYVHFRDVQGTANAFTECFLGDGNCDPLATVRALREIDFHGFLIPDHVPKMEGDTPWGHRARAWTVGYIQALLTAIPGQAECGG